MGELYAKDRARKTTYKKKTELPTAWTHKEVLHRPYDLLVILSKLLHITVTAEFKDQPVFICKTYNCIQLFLLVALHLIQESNESPSSNHSIHSCRSSVASRCINLSTMTAARQRRTPPFLNRGIEGELGKAWVYRRPQVYQLIYCHEFYS